MKKILSVTMVMALVAFATLAPPISANAMGFHLPLDTGQTYSDPYNGDITKNQTFTMIEERLGTQSASGTVSERAAGYLETSIASIATASPAPKGGGFFGADIETEYRPII